MGFFNSLSSTGLGIDLGTSNIVVYVRNKGVEQSEPNVVAVRKLPHGGKEMIAYGYEAKKMEGKTPQGVSVIYPLREGVIANYEMTEAVLRHYLSKVSGEGRFSKPQVVITAPSKVTEVERRAVIDAAVGAGAREAFILDEPLAAALGAGLPITEAQGSMVVDVGGGITEVAVISLGGIVVSNKTSTAGYEMDQAIIAMLKERHELVIGERTAEMIKLTIGSVVPFEEEETMQVKGQDTADGLPKEVTITSEEIREVLIPQVNRIEEAIRITLEQTPPELTRDLMECGIKLVGGAAQLVGLAERLSYTFQTPVSLAEDPMYAVAMGVGYTIDHFDQCRSLLTSVRKRSK